MRCTPLSPSRAVLALICLGLLLSSLATAQVNVRGRWTSKNNSNAACWGEVQTNGFCKGSEPVHMLLTRDYEGHHSQLLWYEGHQHGDGQWQSGIWAWDPATATSGQNCSTYPSASFSALDFGDPGYNIFCGSHVVANGVAHLAGGTVSGEGGSKQSVLYDPSAGTWAPQDTMKQWRWYPTSTVLNDGRVLVSSGSMYLLMQGFGGRTAPSGGTMLPHDLETLALTPPGFWETATGHPTFASGFWPDYRESHSATWMKKYGTWIIFGGRVTGDTLFN